MDFGASVGLDALVGSDPDSKLKLYGSSFFYNGGGSKGSSKVARLSDTDSLFSDSQHMLCFSNTCSSPLQKTESLSSPALPCPSYTPSVYSNSAGLSSGGMMVGGGGRGLFTPSQWMELEHQALIYKYINANVPVPSNLLLPIRKAFESAGLCYSAGLLRPSSLGWGGFQLGFSNNSDPEPGRCRRTDGKKWRCSKDAVADQKYCERHMNRGRHRSRKPVEGLIISSGHPVSHGPATTMAATVTNKPGLPVNSRIQSGGLSLLGDSTLNRFFMNKENPTEKIQNPSPGFSLTPSNPKHKSKSSLYPIDSSLLSSSHNNLGTLKDLTAHEPDPVHTNFRVGGGEPVYNEPVQRQTMNWIPISWENSMGGPLGEVLQNANGSMDSKNSSSVLNLMTDGWDRSSGSPLGSSPTGVLQKAGFGSVSNSSAGSSPRADENRSRLLDG